MATLETKWIDVGVRNVTSTIILYGYQASQNMGDIAETPDGATNTIFTPAIYGTNVAVNHLYWTTFSSLTFQLSGVRANSGWEILSIGGVEFARSAASHSQTSTSTTWSWNQVSNPFGTTAGANKEILWDDGVSDNIPDDFELGSTITGAALSTNYFSNVITVSGMDTGVSQTVSVSGTGSPAYSKNGGSYTTGSGSVVNGDTLQLRVTSSSTSNTTVTGTLTLVSGTSEDTFSVTTAAASGSGDLPDPGSSTYGLEIRGPNGTTKVLTPNKRYGNVKGTINIILSPGQTKTYTVAEANGTNTFAVMILSEDTGLIQITKFTSSFSAKNLSTSESSIAIAAIVLVE